MTKISKNSKKEDIAQSFPLPLSKEDETIEIEKFRNGDMAARDKLITHNLRLVVHIAKKYSGDQEELISVGTIGLIKGVDSYKPEKGSALATYVARCIDNEILMYFRSNKRHVNVIPLSAEIVNDHDNSSVELQEVLAGDDDLKLIDMVQNSFLMSHVFEVFKHKMTEKEQLVLIYRFGLEGGYPRPQREIAEMIGISRSYISRIEKKAMEILKEEMAKFADEDEMK